MTKNGIEYNLIKSPYYVRVNQISIGNEILLFFSSQKNALKFSEKYKDYTNEFNLKYSLKFKIDIDLTLVSIINLYQQIEHRGFYIKINGSEFSCLNTIKLDGLKMTKKNYQD